jgi:hypothetical protein
MASHLSNDFLPRGAMATISPVTGHQPAFFANAPGFNLDPVLPVFRRFLSDIDGLSTLKTAIHCVDSSPFINVCLISLRSAPYAYLGDKHLLGDFDNGVSCRLRYLESAVTSTASVVYNFVFGVIFSTLSLVTLGQVKILTDQMHKNWIHTALATSTLAISSIGTVSPAFGIKANLGVVFAIGIVLAHWMQEGLVSKIGTAYQRHSRDLRAATAEACLRNGRNFDREFTPFYNYLDSHLNDRVNTLPKFISVAQGAAQHLPRVFPVASPDVIFDQLRQLMT